MGYDFYQRSPEARAVFDRADDLLGFALSTLCFDGPKEELTDTVNQQPALFVTSVAAWHTMLAQGWETPAFVAGHSLGEFSALVTAGSLSFADGLKLVRRRGELMQLAGERSPGAMAAILALDTAVTQQLCTQASEETGQVVKVANDNCPGQIVISGGKEALLRAMALAQEAGARKVVQLPITIAAHSPLMASVAAEFAQAVVEADIQPPQVPVIGNVSARPLTTAKAIRDEVTAQLTAPVAWTASIEYMVAQGVDTFVEVGAGEVLLGLTKRISRKAKRIKYTIDD
jgi:[acyl-carrier-protein] S-malonyltransferase